MTAKPQLRVEEDGRVRSDGEGHSFPGRTEYLILSDGKVKLRIPWRSIPVRLRDRPELSTSQAYTFVIRVPKGPEDGPSVVRILQGSQLIYEASHEDHQDWLEADPARYRGEYAYTFSPNQDSESSVTCRIVITARNGVIEATYSVQARDDKQSTSVALQRVRIEGSAFEANPPAIKSAFPFHLPSTFGGRFVKRFPSPNGKGSVDSGLLLGDEFYKRRPSA
jgi:hypothetical protein